MKHFQLIPFLFRKDLLIAKAQFVWFSLLSWDRIPAVFHWFKCFSVMILRVLSPLWSKYSFLTIRYFRFLNCQMDNYPFIEMATKTFIEGYTKRNLAHLAHNIVDRQILEQRTAKNEVPIGQKNMENTLTRVRRIGVQKWTRSAV